MMKSINPLYYSRLNLINDYFLFPPRHVLVAHQVSARADSSFYDRDKSTRQMLRIGLLNLRQILEKNKNMTSFVLRIVWNTPSLTYEFQSSLPEIRDS